jgi:glutamate carboxypeptidase
MSMTGYSEHLRWLDDEQGPMIDLVTRWANVNSGTRNIPGLDTMLGLLDKEFLILGGTQEIIACEPQDLVNAEGRFVQEHLGRALRIRKRPAAEKQVFLGIHYDTVYGVDHPFQRCVRLDESRLCGPGVADAKGGLAIMLKALEAFEKSPWAAHLGWEVLINPDEEVGSPGSAGILAEAARDKLAGLVFEPSFPDGVFVGSRKGTGNFSAVFHGKAAHAGRDVSSGRNAINAMAEFILGLKSGLAGAPGVIVNVANVRGGGPLNIVPDLACCGFNVRVETARDRDAVEAVIAALAAEIEKREDLSVQILGRMMRPPKLLDGKTLLLFECLKQCGTELGIVVEWRPSGGASDGNLLAAAGLPTIDSLGPQGGNLHSAEEYLRVPSLTERAKLTALMLMKLASGAVAPYDRG